MNRRYGDPVRPAQAYRRRPGVYAVLLDGDHILTTFQHAPLPEYQLPGGGIDAGEQPLAALYREVREETGWSITAPRHLGTYRRFTYMPEYDLWAEKICKIFLARPVRRLSAPTEPGHEAVWMSAEAALGLLSGEGDRAMLARALTVEGRRGRPQG
jgi:8-oxo-dGTP diphosphatase